MSYSKRGADFLNRQAAVGLTLPTTIFEKMRQLNASAIIFDADVRNFSRRDVFKQAWATWYANWQAYFDKTMTESGKAAVLLHISDTEAQVEQYRQDFSRFQQTYSQERDENGNPLPSNSLNVPAQPQGDAPNPKEPPKEDGIPLWAFLLGAGVLAAGVYTVIRLKKTYDITAARGRALESGVSKMLPPPFGEAFAAGHHDPTPRVNVNVAAPAMPAVATGHDCGCAHDPEIRVVPRPHLRYLLSGH